MKKPKGESLICDLGADRIPQTDLETLLEWSFKGGSIRPEDRLAVIHKTEAGEALRVVYDKGGRLVDVIALEHWSDAHAEALRAEIDREATSQLTKIARSWAFASVTTTGSWRYRDEFQIVAPPVDAPVADQLVADHPFVLEVAFSDSSHGVLSINRAQIAIRRVELLLNVLLRFDIHTIRPSAGKVWTLVEKQRDPLVLSSELRPVGFAVEGFRARSEDFSPPLEGLPEVDIRAYFASLGIGTRDTLGVPSGLEGLLDIFFGLDPDREAQFLRACYWFQYSGFVWQFSMSGAFTALIQAIETLLPPAPGGRHCARCNRSLGPGPTARFMDFVEEHAPGLTKAARQHLYRIRSDLSHGLFLLSHDEYAGFGGRFTPQHVGQRSDFDQARTVARVAIINWLARALSGPSRSSGGDPVAEVL